MIDRSIVTTLPVYYFLGRQYIIFQPIITRVATKTCGDIFGVLCINQILIDCRRARSQKVLSIRRKKIIFRTLFVILYRYTALYLLIHIGTRTYIQSPYYIITYYFKTSFTTYTYYAVRRNHNVNVLSTSVQCGVCVFRYILYIPIQLMTFHGAFAHTRRVGPLHRCTAIVGQQNSNPMHFSRECTRKSYYFTVSTTTRYIK